MLAALIRKELLALSRDHHGLAALFLMPMVFIVVMSLALKDIYAPPISALSYAVDLRDDSYAARQFCTDWAARRGAAKPLPAAWGDELRRARLRYVIVVEKGFGAALSSPSAPESVKLRLITDPGLDASLFRTLEAELGGRVGEMRAVAIQERFMGLVQEGAHSLSKLMSAERFGGNVLKPTAVQQNVPAWLVFGMFFVVTAIASLFVQEQRDGTLARLAAMGVPSRVQLLSKALPYLGVNAIQAVLMLSVGVFLMPLFGGDALSLAGVDPAALLFVLAALSFAAVGFALLVASLSRTHAQASLMGPMCNLLMAALGGIMVPTFVMPPVMQSIAAWSPMNWGLEGLLTVVLRHGAIVDVAPHAAKLAVFGLVMISAGSWVFARRIGR
jgi:ABC-2 type transport system permease protein